MGEVVTRIAALFVEKTGPYANLPDVDVWDESRDARKYEGPFPVVAHPPCARWGQLANLVEARYGYAVGDDEGCFASALASVRQWGGVLEHPAISAAWPAFGLTAPHRGGWYRADELGGWTCEVDQSHFGHKARKATWLYAFGATHLPSLPWSRKNGTHSIRRMEGCNRPEIPKSERHITPLPFRDMLISIARSAQVVPSAAHEQNSRTGNTVA
jgi:hypothetical protein